MLALVAGSLLAACGDGPSDAASTQTNKPNKPAVPGSEVVAEMVAAVSAGNNSSNISVHFKLGAIPVVRQALPVDIAIVPHREYSSVLAHFEGPEGLAVTVGNVLDPVSSPAAEKPIRHQLVLLPGREGVYMMTVGVETQGQDGNVTRIFSIPVIVAAQAPAPPAAPEPPNPAPPAAN